jgi:hypothetical protein
MNRSCRFQARRESAESPAFNFLLSVLLLCCIAVCAAVWIPACESVRSPQPVRWPYSFVSADGSAPLSRLVSAFLHHLTLATHNSGSMMRNVTTAMMFKGVACMMFSFPVGG